MLIQIYQNTGDAKPVETIETGNFLAVYDGGDHPEYSRYLTNLKFSDKAVIKQSYAEVIDRLKEVYSSYIPEFLSSRNVLIMVDENWQPTEKSSVNSRWKVEITRANGAYSLFAGCDYIIKMRSHWLDQWSEAQINAAILGQLLRVQPNDGSVLKYTEDYHSKMISTFGEKYLDPHVCIPNALEEKINIVGFKRADGQVSIFEADESDEQSA